MTSEEEQRLKMLMKKHVNRLCTTDEKNELLSLVHKTSSADMLDECWKELWNETETTVHLNDLSWDKLNNLHHSNQSKIDKRSIWKRIYRYSAAVAAVFLAICVVANMYYDRNGLTTYKTRYGEVKVITLDDGTRVDLNANSKIHWEKNWRKTGVRKVQLIGEANFDVAHVNLTKDSNSTRMPFKIYTYDLTVNVLGTRFTVSKRRSKTEVFLMRGSIELLLNKKDDSVFDSENDADMFAGKTTSLKAIDSSERIIKLTPNEYVSYSLNEKTLIQKKIDRQEYPAEWKRGVLSYHDVSFNEMIQNIEDIYGHSFEIDDQKLISKRVDFNLPYKSWETVRSMLEVMLSIQIIEVEKNKYLIK